MIGNNSEKKISKFDLFIHLIMSKTFNKYFTSNSIHKYDRYISYNSSNWCKLDNSGGIVPVNWLLCNPLEMVEIRNNVSN